MHDLNEIGFIPILRGHRSGIAARVMLVVGHQHRVVIRGSVSLVIPARIGKGNGLHNQQALGREDGVKLLNES